MSLPERWSLFTDDELQAFTRAIDSAFGEGAWGGDPDVVLQQEIAAELEHRGICATPAYSKTPVDPADWLGWMTP